MKQELLGSEIVFEAIKQTTPAQILTRQFNRFIFVNIKRHIGFWDV